jgi:hypothetical protein
VQRLRPPLDYDHLELCKIEYRLDLQLVPATFIHVKDSRLVKQVSSRLVIMADRQSSLETIVGEVVGEAEADVPRDIDTGTKELEGVCHNQTKSHSG